MSDSGSSQGFAPDDSDADAFVAPSKTVKGKKPVAAKKAINPTGKPEKVREL